MANAYAIDSSYLRETLGRRPKHTFEAGIRRAVERHTENLEWVFEVTAGIADRGPPPGDRERGAREETRAQRERVREGRAG